MSDEIIRSIDIRTTAEESWDLISEPGWWINEGSLDGHRIEGEAPEVVVHDEALGAFPVGIETLEPPQRAVFTWHAGSDTGVPRTRVEFTLTPLDPTTVRLTVRETGFEAMETEVGTEHREANESGWEQELALAADELGRE